MRPTFILLCFFALFKFSSSIWTFAANLNRTKQIVLVKLNLYWAFDYHVKFVSLVVKGSLQ